MIQLVFVLHVLLSVHFQSLFRSRFIGFKSKTLDKSIKRHPNGSKSEQTVKHTTQAQGESFLLRRFFKHVI